MIEAILAFFRALLGIKPGTPEPTQTAPIPPNLPTSSRFQACLAEVLRHEGGYADHPSDPGGATNMGITIGTLSDWIGRPASKQDVRDLTQADAAGIYRAKYWQPIRGDALPPGVDLAVFDLAVNSGVGRAVKMLQGVLGVAQDGTIGPVTLAAVAKAPGQATVIIDLCAARMRFLRSLKTWPTFGKGWTRRVEEVEAAAMKAAAS